MSQHRRFALRPGAVTSCGLTPHQPGTKAREIEDVFEVWFYGRTTPRQTILMSRLTILFFLGLPGFRSKLWLLNDSTGEFGGIYEWDTMQDAASVDH